MVGSDPLGVVFDDSGEAWPAQPALLERRLGPEAGSLDVIANAVSNLGFVHVAPIRDALSVRFEPAVVSPLAAVAAFYEIVARGPRCLILTYPGPVGHPDRCEVFNNVIEGLERLEDAANRGRREPHPVWLHRPSSARRPRHSVDRAFPKRKLPAGSSGTGSPQTKSRAGDRSVRWSRPLDAIAADDGWLGQVLSFWGSARRGRRLPSNESLELAGTAEHSLRAGPYRRYSKLKSVRVPLSSLGNGQLLWARLRQSRARRNAGRLDARRRHPGLSRRGYKRSAELSPDQYCRA